MARTGRPRIEIDQATFENLCRLQCTLEEISSWFKCSEDTIERWCKRELKMSFADAYAKNAAAGRISLRRSQFRLAETNSTMGIWLGKQYLGQTDNGPRDGGASRADDGFISALTNTAAEDWIEEKEGGDDGTE